MDLKALFPWPATRPDFAFDADGWLCEETAALLRERAKTARTIVEVGSWLGLSTRFMLDQNPESTVICIDTWLGSFEHFHENVDLPRIRTLYDRFLASCWDYRERIVPVRLDSVSGIKLAAKAGVVPDLVYLDGGHQYEIVSADLREISKAWPTVPVVLDDYIWPGVTQACAESGRRLTVHGYAATLE